MRSRALAFLPVLLLSPLLLAPECNFAPVVNSIQIFAPAADAPNFDVYVQVQIPAGATFSPATGVKLNGVPIPVSQEAGNSLVYSATVSPGFPLQGKDKRRSRPCSSKRRTPCLAPDPYQVHP